MSKLKLIVGLGNPGPQYEHTRHNAGAWFVTTLAQQYHVTLKENKKFQGLVGQLHNDEGNCHLLIPTTYMNLSGQAVQQFCRFYQIPLDAILIAHDELDLPVGTVRIKQGGGDGGHNGLRSLNQHLGSKAFNRLRIGIAHPGHRDLVSDYVLKKPTPDEREKILTAIDTSVAILTLLQQGEWQKAMHELHTVE